jgi:DNA-directed RNA polymerase subunit RPC12/RpoP
MPHTKIEIYTEYKCAKGHKWVKYWRKYPWLRDYSQRCPNCGQVKWPAYKYDNTHEVMSESERRWDRRRW